MRILGCTLIKTCKAFPEQYDVFYKGEQVGYIRLRHGYMSVEYPDVDGKLVYEKEFRFEKGEFDSTIERYSYLIKAVLAIKKELK